MKAFVPFAAGHSGSFCNYSDDIELFENLHKNEHGAFLGYIHFYTTKSADTFDNY